MGQDDLHPPAKGMYVRTTSHGGNNPSWSIHLISSAGAIIVVSLLGRSGPRVIFIALIEAGGTLQSLLHRRLGTGATSEVSVATNGCKCGRASGEIVLRQWGEAATGVIRPTTIASGKAHVVMTCGVE